MKQVLKKVHSMVYQELESKEAAVLFGVGYYSLLVGVTDFSLNSVKDGFELARNKNNRAKIMYGILCNDIKRQTLEEEVPSHLLEPFEDENVLELLLFYYENKVKNRAIRTLRKIHKKAYELLLWREEGGETKVYDQTNTCLVGRKVGDKYSALCPAIMAQYYHDTFTELENKYPRAKSLVVIDWCEIIDEQKVLNGRELFFSTFAKFFGKNHKKYKIINVFYGDDSGMAFKVSAVGKEPI